MPSYYSLALLFALSLAIGDALFGITFLQPDEQVLLKGLSTLTVRNGPGLKMYPPLVTRVTKRKGTTLDERQYVVVTNTLTGARRVEKGPQLFFAGPHDEFDDALRLAASTTGAQQAGWATQRPAQKARVTRHSRHEHRMEGRRTGEYLQFTAT